MAELIGGVVCVAAGLAALAALGHALWIGAAWIVRQIRGLPPEPSNDGGGTCPRCGLPSSVPCKVCGWPGAAIRLQPQVALEILRRQVDQLVKLGVLDAEAASAFSSMAPKAEQCDSAMPPLAAIPSVASSPWTIPATASHANVDAAIVDAELVEAVEVSSPGPIHPAPLELVQDIAASSGASVEQRAAAYEARQVEARQTPTPITSLSSVPSKPAPGLADWLSAFMEERNMRWGELVGGLLIVCCSIALVVSFWSAISERPWLKFFLFNGVTAGLFGLGFHSFHRWRLQTTSQGLLIIASLLVPLNFLAISALASSGATTPLSVVGETVSAALFAGLLYMAGDILVGSAALPLAMGVLLPSLAQLLVRRFAGPDAPLEMLLGLSALPLLGYLSVNAWTTRQLAAPLVMTERDVDRLFKFLGITSFAVLAPLALLLFKTEHPLETARRLSLVVSLLGLAPLTGGLFIWQKLAGRGLSGLRMAGTAVAVCGAGVGLAGLALAWPDPLLMAVSGWLQFLIFTFVAWRFALPAAHLAAGACLALAYTLAAHLLSGQLTLSAEPHVVATTIISGETGTLLAPLVVAYALAALLALRHQAASGRALLAVTAGLAAISVALVSWFSFGVEGDLVGATWVYLLYAAGCLAASSRSRHAALAWIGAALLLAGTVQEVVFRYGEVWRLAQPEITAILAFCTLAALIAWQVRWWRQVSDDSPLVDVLWNAAFFCSLVAMGWLVLLMPSRPASYEAVHWMWIAALWLAVTLATGWMPVGTLFQLALVVATVFGVVARLETHAWFQQSPRPWLDPWTLEAIGIALASLGFAWGIVRLACRASSRRHAQVATHLSHDLTRALATPWLAVDRVTNVALAGWLVLLGTYAVAPGVAQELSPGGGSQRVVGSIEAFALPEIPHGHAQGGGAWLLLASVLVVLLTMAGDRLRGPRRISLSVSAAVVGPLLSMVACQLWASRWESEVAVASALRWLSTGLLLAGSVLIWGRRPVTRLARRMGWPSRGLNRGLAVDARNMLFLLSLCPSVIILGSVGVASLVRSTYLPRLGEEAFNLIVVAAAAAIAAGVLRAVPARASSDTSERGTGVWRSALSALFLVLGGAPVVSIVLFHVGMALKQSPILGPDPGSSFGRMGYAVSYALPLLVTSLVMVGYALRDRSSKFALAGGLLLAAGATGAYLLTVGHVAQSFDGEHWLRLAQINALVAAAYTLAWLAVERWLRRRHAAVQPLAADFAFATQLALGPALLGLALVCQWFRVFFHPKGTTSQPLVMYAELADAWGWGTLALVSVSVIVAVRSVGRRPSVLMVSGFLSALVVYSAAQVAPWDTGNWLSFNTLLVGHGSIAMALWGWAAWQSRSERSTVLSASGATAPWHLPAGEGWIFWQGLLVFILAFREIIDNRWWPVGGFSFLGVLLAPAMTWLWPRRRYLYLAAALINLAGTVAWLERNSVTHGEDLLFVNVVLLALPVIAWVAIELRWIRPRRSARSDSFPPVYRIVVWLSLIILGLATASSLADKASPGGLFVSADDTWGWLALGATLLAALAMLWDAKARDSVAVLYVLGLVACGMLLDQFDLGRQWLLWMGTIVIASYALLTSYLWSTRRGLQGLARSLGVPVEPLPELAGQGWLVPCNVMLIAVVVLMTVAVEFTMVELPRRILAAQATLVQVASLALLARGDRRGLLQTAALCVGAIGAVLFGWSWLRVGETLTLLNSLVVVASAWAGVAVLYGFGLGKLLRDGSDWLPPARRLTPWLAGLSGVALLTTLAVEIEQYLHAGSVQMALPAILVVAVTLGGLALAALAAAVLPGRDPLNLSERGRSWYVYGAEIVLALLFVHIRLSMPWLFSGLFQQYWPLVVMALAFVGVGVAELCRRREQHVLARPLENTGALLPVLPVLGFWASDSSVDYSLLLVMVGLLYAGLSIARRSFGFGVLAALAANGGLWYFLNRQDGLAFFSHPQVWLIPPALCVLAAAYINRRQLSDAQMTTVRYLTSMVIYVSSTGDIFLNGVAAAPWLPLVLGALAIAGVLAGIALRVRAFLFLGTSFLVLALFTIIWHAAVDLEQTWIFYATGIIVGILIFALFALFEKKRDEMLELVETIKRWDG